MTSRVKQFPKNVTASWGWCDVPPELLKTRSHLCFCFSYFTIHFQSKNSRAQILILNVVWNVLMPVMCLPMIFMPGIFIWKRSPSPHLPLLFVLFKVWYFIYLTSYICILCDLDTYQTYPCTSIITLLGLLLRHWDTTILTHFYLNYHIQQSSTYRHW